MIKFHGVSFEAKSRAAAYDYLEENYPESRCDQLEDEQQSREREQRTYEHAQRCLDDPYYDIDNSEY
jgi:hypothetical protein